MKLTTLLVAATSFLFAAAAPAPYHLGKCATPDFNHQLFALSATLGGNGASLFPHLLIQLSATKDGCKAVYPLVTEAKTILAPQDSAMTADLVAEFTANPSLLGEYYSTTTELHRTDFFNQANRVIELESATAIYWVGGMASLWLEIKGTTNEAVVLQTDIATATGTALILKNAWGQPATLVKRGWPPCSTCK
ncbi:uncharacterized protein LOC62_03G004802 [Vanrija pseudolonga]|uniref:Uncharacterized protein n=1 Tax=Vanrija pseudolonga TaxID=143232 RepID=A0AAF0Y6S6_9TREE|nr:hypothetical protein LOC62_03G004802 [Vanrija pseudolonga]